MEYLGVTEEWSPKTSTSNDEHWDNLFQHPNVRNDERWNRANVYLFCDVIKIGRKTVYRKYSNLGRIHVLVVVPTRYDVNTI